MAQTTNPVPKTDNSNTTVVAAGVLEDLRVSPTPYHAVARAVELLDAAGFSPVDETEPFPPETGGRYLVRDGSLIAWWQRATTDGFCIVGAHTDSPNLRVRTKPDVVAGGFQQIGMEIYGGVLLNSWLDRDLGLAGRVSVDAGSGRIESMLYNDDTPVLRIPQLAIHLDREIREKGLKLDPQRHMTPLWALDDTADGTDASDGDNGSGSGSGGNEGQGDYGRLRHHVAGQLGIAASEILAWDLMTFDTQPPAVVGRDGDMFASGRIDNLVSAFCGVRALIATAGDDLPRTPVLVLYDHEEIGSESATGAAGPLLAATLERIANTTGDDRGQYLASLADSLVISADGAHATHPNYVERHEPSHHIALNQGVVIKRNANQRYATDATSEAFVVAACAEADVPLQYYIHRNDLPCGSTIGPITSARLGMPTVDVGAPQLAMHSAREMAGLADLDHLHDLLATAWRRR